MQDALEELVMDALLVAAFDAMPSKLEAAGPPLRACLRAASLAAARCGALALVVLPRASFSLRTAHSCRTSCCSMPN